MCRVKGYVFTLSWCLVLLVVSSMSMISCTPATPASQEIVPVKVELLGTSTLSAGPQYVDLVPVFAVTNPNSVMVTLTSLEYTLSVEDEQVVLSQIGNKVYIPAETQVNVSGAVSVGWGALWMGKFIGEGKQAPEAMMSVLPVWKKLGGALPMEAFEKPWEGLPGPPVTYEVEGTARVFCGGEWMDVPISAK